MSFFDKVGQAFGAQKQANNVRVTAVGNKRLEELQPNAAEYTVLSAIKRHEPCTVSEVVKDPQVKFSYDQVYDTMIRFLGNGWIEIAR